MKLLAIINWVLISSWGVAMIYSLFAYLNQTNTHMDSESRHYSIALLTAGFVVFFVTAGLNLLPYNWTRIVALLMGTLTLANSWNVYEMILPDHNTLLYRILDAFWPISNIIMVRVGVAVVRAGRLTGWKRYVPLACGFPLR